MVDYVFKLDRLNNKDEQERLRQAWNDGYRIVVESDLPEVYRRETEQWLITHVGYYHEVRMCG